MTVWVTNNKETIEVQTEDLNIWKRRGYEVTDAPEAPKKVAKRTSNEE